MFIPLAKPEITEVDIESVVSVMRNGRLALGPTLHEFEEKFASYVGTSYAKATSSGTAALHLIWTALGLKDGDEVITTPFSFIASSNSILLAGAKPVFCDIEPEQLMLDVSRIEAKITHRTKAILTVDIFGYPCCMKPLRELASQHRIALVEDACEAVGARRDGFLAGSQADAATFGFYPNKQMTTGEGGVVTSNDKELIDLITSLRNQGRSLTNKCKFERLGFNYRMSDLNAGLGLSQLRRIDKNILSREQVAKNYEARLMSIKGISFLHTEPSIQRSWFVYVVKLDQAYNSGQRDKLMAFLLDRGVETSHYFPAIHLQPFYVESFGYKKGDFPITESVADRVLAIPFFMDMTESEMDYVVDSLKQGLDVVRA